MTRTPLIALLLAVPLVACNAITGADALVIDDQLGEKRKGGGDPNEGSSGNGDPGAGGSSAEGAGGAATTGGATTGTGAPEDPLGDAQGVTIDEIAIYQAMKRPIMANGATASSSIPIVANKAALMRVFVTTTGAYDGGPVTAQLYLDDATTPIETTAALGPSSSDASLASTINFDLPASALGGRFSYRFVLKQTGSTGDNPGARYPASGSDSVPVQSSGSILKVKLVPVSYGGDGSNRLPDTSAAQLERYKDLFYAMYPVPQVDISVRASVGWASQVSSNGSGWDSLLGAIADLREQDNAPNDVYYYGIFAPASSASSYCSGGCVAGLGFVGGPTDSYSRAAIGLGFSGEMAAETSVHEIGHTHGRNHAPCGGASGTDQSFPYGDGSVGVWGYNPLTKKLFNPGQTADVMSYCNPIWLSDYTYKALFNRIKTVNNPSIVFPPETLNRTYERVRVDGDGNLTWLDKITLRTPPMGDTKDVVLDTDGGSEIQTAHFYGFDHLAGGVLLWPESQKKLQAVKVDIAGKLVHLSR